MINQFLYLAIWDCFGLFLTGLIIYFLINDNFVFAGYGVLIYFLQDLFSNVIGSSLIMEFTGKVVNNTSKIVYNGECLTNKGDITEHLMFLSKKIGAYPILFTSIFFMIFTFFFEKHINICINSSFAV